jgi:hypothetical protein
MDVVASGHRSVQDVISRLKFVATLQPGERIDVSSLTVLPDTILGRMYRAAFARGESRTVTLEFVRQTLTEAFDMVERFGHGPETLNSRIGDMIVRALSASKAGIASLAETYSEDRMFVSRIGTLLATLDAKIIDIVGATTAPTSEE